ncbi:hypothetical protein D3C85_1757380 [compost metagenome]
MIDLHVDPRQEFVPRIKSRVDAQGAFVTPELDDMHPFLDQATLERIRTEALAIRATSPTTEESGGNGNG